MGKSGLKHLGKSRVLQPCSCLPVGASWTLPFFPQVQSSSFSALHFLLLRHLLVSSQDWALKASTGSAGTSQRWRVCKGSLTKVRPQPSRAPEASQGRRNSRTASGAPRGRSCHTAPKPRGAGWVTDKEKGFWPLSANRSVIPAKPASAGLLPHPTIQALFRPAPARASLTRKGPCFPWTGLCRGESQAHDVKVGLRWQSPFARATGVPSSQSPCRRETKQGSLLWWAEPWAPDSQSWTLMS